MGFVQGTSLVLLGLLGVASFARRHAKEHLVALCLIQFGMGGWATFWGWYRTFFSVSNLEWFSNAPIYWSTTTADAVAQLLLGLLLLAGMALTLMTGRDEGSPRTSLRRKVAIAQLVTGVLAVALGVWTAVYGFVATVVWGVGN